MDIIFFEQLYSRINWLSNWELCNKMGQNCIWNIGKNTQPSKLFNSVAESYPMSLN